MPASGRASAPCGQGRSAEAAAPPRARAERAGGSASSSRHFPAASLPADSSGLGTETEAETLEGRGSGDTPAVSTGELSFTSRYPPVRGGATGEERRTGEEQRTGEERTGEEQTGEERRTGEERTGEEQTGEEQTGEEQTGEERRTGEEQTGEEQTGEEWTGEEQTGEERRTGEEWRTGKEHTGEEQRSEELRGVFGPTPDK